MPIAGSAVCALALIIAISINSVLAAGLKKASDDMVARNAAAPGGGEHNRTHSIGDRFVLGSFAYTIHGVSTSDTIGDPDTFGERATSGGTFLIIDFTIENLGKESTTVISDDFELLDPTGRKFTTSSDATTALLTVDKGKDFLLSELQPGLPVRTRTAFEIPRGAFVSGLALIVPEKGVFGSKESRVLLRK